MQDNFLFIFKVVVQHAQQVYEMAGRILKFKFYLSNNVWL
jgi:hypothetical protein